MAKREIIKTWYRATKPDGSVWCESSDPQEVLDRSDSDCSFQKLDIVQVTGPWKAWRPHTTDPIPLDICWAYVGYRAHCNEQGCPYKSQQHPDPHVAERVGRAHCFRAHGTNDVKVTIYPRRGT